MNSPDPSIPLSGMLQAWSAGDESALEQLTPIVYAQLRLLASAKLVRERADHILQPSALVNEAFIRLMGNTRMEFQNRTHFFAFAARLMRQILVDFARAQTSAKRGNRAPHIGIDVATNVAIAPERFDFIDIDIALDELAKLEPRQARVVELRYFSGLENSEVAEVLGISEDTVLRDWRMARAWLYDRLHLSGD